jgi:glutamine synthetase
MQFLVFCAAVIRGVRHHGPLHAGRGDRRLATITALAPTQAPPAIISVYLGSQLEDVFNQIKAGELKGSTAGGLMQLGVDTLPHFPRIRAIATAPPLRLHRQPLRVPGRGLRPIRARAPWWP